MHFFLLLLLFVSLTNRVFCDEVWISSAEELVQLKDNVNSGTNYSGTTVFLDSDLSLSEVTFEPIGNGTSKYFLGVFDGQGHVISNLKMSSSVQYAGLFGYSTRLTIKNIILDPSCSVASSLSGSNQIYIGGIIGYCRADNGPCTIENSVNMGVSPSPGAQTAVTMCTSEGLLAASTLPPAMRPL